jgi:hypothetical protein
VPRTPPLPVSQAFLLVHLRIAAKDFVNRILPIADDRETVPGIPDLLALMRLRIATGEYRVEEAVLLKK